MVAEDKKYDLGGTFVNRKTNQPLAVAFVKARTEWTVLDDSIKADFEALEKVQRGDFSVISRTVDDQNVDRRLHPRRRPVAYYVYDRKAKKADVPVQSPAEAREVQARADGADRVSRPTTA